MQRVPENVSIARVSPSPTEEGASQEVFSTLDLRDRVVIMALFYEIVEIEQVEKAWCTWRALQQGGKNLALWRVLVQDADVDQDAIYEVAAQIYGFETADINRLRALALIQDLEATFTQEQWQRLIELLLVPIAVGEDPRSGMARLVFATHDPTRPEVLRQLQQFNLTSFELRFAPPSSITALFSEAFEPKIKSYTPLQEEEIPVEYEVVPEKPATEEDTTAKEIELDRSSLVDWFESVLIATYQARATEAHIFLNTNKELEIHFRINNHLQFWRKEDTMHPEGLLAYVMDDVIKVDDFDPKHAMEVSFQRWIDKDLTRFQVAIQAAPDSVERYAATVVVRVLGHREASSDFDGMGPWKLR